MTGGGKRGKPQSGFPLFPPPLEIVTRFPHSHRLDDETLDSETEPPLPNCKKEPLLGSGYPDLPSRLIFQLECACAESYVPQKVR